MPGRQTIASYSFGSKSILPVFQEDEIILIAAGGVLGLIAGMGQTRLGWGGPGANLRALVTLTLATVSSASYFLFKEVIEKPVEVVVKEEEITVRHATIRRRKSVFAHFRCCHFRPHQLPSLSVLSSRSNRRSFRFQLGFRFRPTDNIV